MTEATIQPPALTGQDIAEAQDAVRSLLDQILARLVERDLITADGPITLTGAGTELHAGLTATVQRSTSQLYAGFDPGDLEVAHRVLKEITERAGRLCA